MEYCRFYPTGPHVRDCTSYVRDRTCIGQPQRIYICIQTLLKSKYYPLFPLAILGNFANNNSVINTNETLPKSEQRKFLKTTLEGIFVQQIYSAVIRSLVAFGDGDGDFVLDKDECDFLARTYQREKLGAREAALVCLGPARRHSHQNGCPTVLRLEKEKAVREKAEKEKEKQRRRTKLPSCSEIVNMMM